MKVCILDGNMADRDNDFTFAMLKVQKKLEENHSVDYFPLKKMKLRFCTGCWSCWWATPGRCILRDDAEDIFRAVISSDLLILASPLMAGFPSSLLKKITDRLIVLLHPYTRLKDGECHHMKRYDQYPDLGLILEKEADTDEEDLLIVGDIFRRMALNFHGRFRFLYTTDSDSFPEVSDETGTH